MKQYLDLEKHQLSKVCFRVNRQEWQLGISIMALSAVCVIDDSFKIRLFREHLKNRP
jgi:hypothetical protein